MIKMNNFKDILCLSGNKKEHPLDQWVFLKGGLIWFQPSAELFCNYHVSCFLKNIFSLNFLKNTFLNEKYCFSNKKYLEFQVFVFK